MSGHEYTVVNILLNESKIRYPQILITYVQQAFSTSILDRTFSRYSLTGNVYMHSPI